MDERSILIASNDCCSKRSIKGCLRSVRRFVAIANGMEAGAVSVPVPAGIMWLFLQENRAKID